MSLTVDQFVRTANAGWFDNAVVLNKTGTLTSKFFHPKPDGGNKANWATNQIAMRAFREALENEFGATGTEAFKRLLDTRYVTGRSLRKSDINAVIAEIQDVQKAAEHEKAHAERTVIAFGEETLTKLMADKHLPYHTLPKDDQTALRGKAMEALKEMMQNEASRENILGEIKTPKAVKFFEARMAVLVKEAARNITSVVCHLQGNDGVGTELEVEIPDFMRPDKKVEAQPEVKAEAQPEAKVEAKSEAKANIERLRNELRSHFDEAWTGVLKEPSYVISRGSKTSQAFFRTQALKALEERLEDDAMVRKFHHSYEKNPNTLRDALYVMAIRTSAADLTGVLIED